MRLIEIITESKHKRIPRKKGQKAKSKKKSRKKPNDFKHLQKIVKTQ